MRQALLHFGSCWITSSPLHSSTMSFREDETVGAPELP